MSLSGASESRLPVQPGNSAEEPDDKRQNADVDQPRWIPRWMSEVERAASILALAILIPTLAIVVDGLLVGMGIWFD